MAKNTNVTSEKSIAADMREDVILPTTWKTTNATTGEAISAPRENALVGPFDPTTKVSANAMPPAVARPVLNEMNGAVMTDIIAARRQIRKTKRRYSLAMPRSSSSSGDAWR